MKLSIKVIAMMLLLSMLASGLLFVRVLIFEPEDSQTHCAGYATDFSRTGAASAAATDRGRPKEKRSWLPISRSCWRSLRSRSRRVMLSMPS